MPKMNFKPTERDIEIGQKIHGICVSVSDALTDGANAKDAKTAASDHETTGRLAVVLRIAELSAQEDWSETEVNRGCDYASNTPENDGRIAKSLQNLCSEMRNVAHPKVRDAVPTIHQACVIAWNAETNAIENDKDAPRPLRDFAKRLSHLVLRAIKEQRIGQETFNQATDVLAWAEANDPAQNADATAKLIERIVDQLGGIYANFPEPDVKNCADTLASITAKVLRKFTAPLPQSTQKPVRATQPRPASPPKAPPLTAVQQPENRPGVDVAQGVAALDEYLNDAQIEAFTELAEAAD